MIDDPVELTTDWISVKTRLPRMPCTVRLENGEERDLPAAERGEPILRNDPRYAEAVAQAEKSVRITHWKPITENREDL